MNRVEAPDWFDDHQSIEDLSNNHRVASFPDLRPYVGDIRGGYAQYVDGNGDATVVNDVVIPDPIRAHLRRHYASPSADICYIKEIRELGGIKTCPMCGSRYGGTLDHIFPKEDFACFAIFGLNLVPACKCNSLRGRALVGAGAGERILHPYFDDLLGERLIVAHFEDLGAVPKVSVRTLLDVDDPNFAAVSFHLVKVVLRTQVVDWLQRQWTKFVLKPGNVIRDLRSIPADRDELLEILQCELEMLDEYNEGKNNWESMFVAGLMEGANTADWVFDQLSRAGRLPYDPLLEV